MTADGLPPGSGRQLYESEPVFREALDECAELLGPVLDVPLLAVLRSDDPALAAWISLQQPAVFALQHSLVRLWASWGIEPAMVAGHSTGELVAATAAGVLELRDALALVTASSAAIDRLPTGGVMVAAAADEADVRRLIEPYADRVGLAAVNGPGDVVVSGDATAVEEVAAKLEAEGVAYHPLTVAHALHSPVMAALVEELRAQAATVTYRRPAIPFVSAFTGRIEPDLVATAAYWVDRIPATVRFGAAAALVEAGADHIIEIGAAPRLLSLLARSGVGADRLHPSLCPGHAEREVMAQTLGALWAGGYEPQWRAYHAARGAAVSAPTYPFQRQRHWFETSGSPRPRPAPAASRHPAPEELGAPAPVEGATPDAAAVVLVAPADQRTALVERLVRDEVAAILDVDVELVDLSLGVLELGLDSLMVVELVNRVGASFGVAVTSRALMEADSVAAYARDLVVALAERTDAEPLGNAGAPASLGSEEGSYALVEASSAQQRLLFIEEYEPGLSVYHLPIAARLVGHLDVDALRSAFTTVVRRHHALRTDFEVMDDAVLQKVTAATPFALDVVDLRPLPAAEREAAVGEHLHAEATRPFGVRAGLKLRALLLRTHDEVHVLAITLHHIASDGWSVVRLMQELVALYGASLNGTPAQLPDLPIQYADYSVRQRRTMDSAVMDQHLAYWHEQLAGELPALELATDRPRQAMLTHPAGSVAFTVSADIVEQLRRAGRELGMTPFMLMLAGYVAVLARWSGQDELVIGTAAANREQPDTANLIGLFINTLALRIRVDEQADFRSLLQEVKRAVLDAFEHQDAPFEQVVEALKLNRDPSRPPIFQTTFVFNNMPIPRFELEGISMEPVHVSRGMVDTELEVTLTSTQGALAGVVDFNTDLFDRATIERLVARWQTLLAAVLPQPDVRIDAVPLLPPGERHDLLVRWNDTAVARMPGARVHEVFRAQAARTPEAIAVRMGVEALSYRELDARSDQLARRLRAMGVGLEEYVGVAVDRSPAMVVALLGVLKAGAAYLPLDPGFPPERLAFMVKDSSCRVIVTDGPAIPTGADGTTVAVLDLVADAAVIAAEPASPVEAAGGELAYIIYTSGSTGMPKGVEIEHANVVNFLHSMQRAPGFTSGDTLLAVTTLSFDISVLEIFLPLVSGATLVVASREEAADAPMLAELIERSQATVVQATPTTWSMLLESGWRGQPRLKILCGGEAMPRELAGRLLERCASLWNMFGPTETTIWSTVFAVERGQVGPVPIGRPIDNTVCRVLDRTGDLAPSGVPGELYIGGAGVARGYRNRPELNAERFVADPFVEGGRLYRTGDLARWLADGTLEFLGRMDHQVKLRGHRIELGEVEAELLGLDAVAAAVVIVREDDPGDQRLVAYVISNDGASLDPEQVRSLLATRLPAYMIPSAVVTLDEFPETPNRKVDRKALPRPSTERRAVAVPFVAPRDAVEQMLAGFWEKVLNRSPISVHDNFFDLGGYSLLATRLFAMIEKATGKRLPVMTLFTARTIAELATVLRGGEAISKLTSLVAIQPHGKRLPFFYVAPYTISVLQMAPLGEGLGEDQPLYGLQPPGLDGEAPILGTVEELAAHYISEIKTVQPEGPYQIGGHCSGTWVAWEIARQLEAAGEELATVVMVDLGPPGVDIPKVRLLPFVYQRMRYYLESGSLKYALKWQLDLAVARFWVRRVGSPTERHVEEVRAAHRNAYAVYKGGKIRHDVVLLRTEESTRLAARDWYLRWDEMTSGSFRQEILPGNHGGLLFSPSLDFFAAALQRALEGESAVGEGQGSQR